MENDIKTIFDSHKPQTEFEKLANSSTETSDDQYKAFEIARNKQTELMLEINFRNKTTKQIYYFNIYEISFKDDSLISIVRSQEIIQIEGTKLNLLKDYFRNNRIQKIFEFNPEIHSNYPADNEPVIENIIIESVNQEK